MNISPWIVEGISDEQDTCDCCGRTGLKRTVAMRHADHGVVEFLGTTCATIRLQLAGDAETRKLAKKAEDRKRALIAAARRKEADQHMTKWTLFLRETSGMVGADIPSMIQALGGFAAARAQFLEEQNSL